MAAGATYEPIATNTLGSATASITFSSIPSTYTDLILICNGTNTAGGSTELLLRYNSDTGTNYSTVFMFGNGTTTSSQISGINTSVAAGQTDITKPTPVICHINNYSNSTTYKTSLVRASDSAGKVWASISLWRSTSAISTINIRPYSGNLSSGFTATIYGIAAA